MSNVNTVLVGAGNISASHIKAISSLDDVVLAGISDLSEDARKRVETELGVRTFPDHAEMFDSIHPDYATICTPHDSHAPIAMDALERGIHVFVEKPLAVEAAAAEKCVELAKSKSLTLGVNFIRRLTAAQSEMAKLVREGFIGDLIHATMVCAKRFRTMAYYRSGAWRGTWKGEGGGVLVNQAPHDLDFLIWTLGTPVEVMAELDALVHDIEVEDEVTAMMKWKNGGAGTFYASTNVIPGRETFEVIGTKGSIRLENNELVATPLEADVRDDDDAPPAQGEQIRHSLPKTGNQTAVMHDNFIKAMRQGAPLVCSGEEALEEVRLANAMLVSGIKRKWVSIPVDPNDYRNVLDALIETRSMTQTRLQN